jgi:hypothetical protein
MYIHVYVCVYTYRHLGADNIVFAEEVLSAHVSIRQHTSAYDSIHQHTSAYVSIRQHPSAYISIRQHTSTYVSIRQHTSAYVSIRQHTSAISQRGRLRGEGHGHTLSLLVRV